MVTKLTIGSFLIGALSLIASASARAEDCAIPQFNAARHTYLSQTLQQDSALHAQLDGLADELVTAGNANGHAIIPYFVACQKEYQNGVPGVDLAHDLFEAWKSDSSFPLQSRVVVITWVRNGLNTNHGSVGAVAGTQLADMGFTGDFFASKDGPILRDIRQFMPGDPKGEFVNVVRLVDDWIDRPIARQGKNAQVAKTHQDDSTIPPEVIVFVLLFAGMMFYILNGGAGEDEKTYARRFIQEKGRDAFNTLHQANADLKAMTNLRPLPSAWSNQASTLRAKLVGIGDTDPVESSKAVKEVAREIEHFAKTVKEALFLLEHRIAEMENGLAAAKASITRQRAMVVVFAFPDAATESQESLFKLEEEGENPEELIRHSEEAFAEAKRFLDEGKVDEAKSEFEDAFNAVEKAQSLPQKTLAAKTGAEEIVPSIQQAKLELLDACKKGVEPLEQLKSSDFAPVNYEDVADSVESGRKIADGVDAVIATAAQLYFKQNFLAAKSTLDELLENLTTARTRAESLALRLNELREKRKTVLQNLATVKGEMEALGQKLEESSRASETFRRDYENLESHYRELEQASGGGGSVLINWLVIYAVYESLTSGTTTVSQQSDSGRSSSNSRGSYDSGGSYSSNSGTASYNSNSYSGGAGGGNY